MLNERQTRFCELRAQGRPLEAAYAAAGYTPSASNAACLDRHPPIVARIAELLNNPNTETTHA